MSVSLVSRVLTLFAVAIVASGCAAKSTSTPSSGTTGALGSSEDALSADDSDSQEAENGAEDGIENGLSGAAPTDPGGVADGTDVAAVDLKVKVNPGLYFKPAGCIQSTRLAAGQWSHVFTNCTGPAGNYSYNGTVTSTWTVSAETIVVKHEANGFVVKGPNVTVTLSGSRTVTYTRQNATLSKHRVGTWTGTLSKNADPSKSLPWSHQADFTSTWDTSSKCFTRDGSAENSIGGREFGRKVTGYRACGGILACPSAGELELDRKDGTVKITVTFLGGRDIEITGPKGNTVTRKIVCIAQ